MIGRWCWLRREGLSEVAFVPVALLLSWSLFVIGGLPYTHDGMGIAFLEAYRRAYLARDLIPTWTSFAANGHGSPFPIGYHRLHPQLFAFMALLTSSVVALKASIPTLLVAGGVGMRRLCRSVGIRPWVSWIAGTLLMSANYAVMDWFVRGATAEFTAFMLFPWCLRYARALFDSKWGPWRLAVASALLFYAHMMTFYFFVLVGAVVALERLFELRPLGLQAFRVPLRRGVWFVALLTCAIGTYAAAVKYALAFCGISTLAMRTDDEAYFTWMQFIADPVFSWHRSEVPAVMSPEIGRWMLLCLAVVVAITPRARKAIWNHAAGLVILTVAFIVVQRKPMAFVFALLPGADKIQFPSRLLVDIVNITVFVTAIGVEAALRSAVPWIVAVARAGSIVAALGQGNLAMSSQRLIWTSNVPRSEIDTAMAAPVDVTTGKLAQYATWDLYLPKGLTTVAEAPFLQASAGCTLSSHRLTHDEPVNVVPLNYQCAVAFTVHGDGCSVRLNQYRSSLLQVDLSMPGASRMASDGTTIIEAPHDGTVVTVKERSVLDLARKWLIQKGTHRP